MQKKTMSVMLLSISFLLATSAVAKPSYKTHDLVVEVSNYTQCNDFNYTITGLVEQQSEGPLSATVGPHKQQDVRFWREEETADVVLADLVIKDPLHEDKVIWAGRVDYDLIDRQSTFTINTTDPHYKIKVKLLQPTWEVGPLFKVTVHEVSE